MHTPILARITTALPSAFAVATAVAMALTACQDNDNDGIFVDAEPGADTNGTDTTSTSDGVGGDVPQPLDLLGGDGTGEDASPDGTGQDVGGDTTTTPGAFGTPCTENGDCLDGLCVDTIDGRLCSINCITECPSDDFRCIPITLGGSDPFNACVPKFPNLCKPCQENDDCRNALNPGQSALCVPAADPREGSFCAAACGSDGSCPTAFVCGDVPLEAGGTTKQCLPDDGMCECRPSWAGLGLVTDCTTENAFGSCGGTRTCGPDGLTACGPQVPATETCNRIDDDCSGTADDIIGVPCDIENGFGTCQGVTACDASGGEICQGTAPAAEVCNGLDDNCSGAADEGTCDDGLACTDNVCGGEDRQCANPVRDGSCLIGGQCWAENAPNPEFPCQRCVSAVSKTSWTGDEGDGASCFIDGECWPAGAGKPNEPCLRCRPNLSTTTWQPADPTANISCDDGLACTKNDRCNGAQCSGEAYTCDDGLSCTDNVCIGDGTCNYPTRSGTCLIGGTCYNDGARESAATCSVCDADTTQNRWTGAPAGTTCDDGNLCTSGDACSGDSFTCAGAPFSCDDALACTADACLANGSCSNTLQQGFCLIEGQCYANGASNPDNPCLVCNAAVPGGWSLAPAGTACDDGELCTANDTCTFGACVGSAYSCDGIGCCVGDGTCTNETPPGAVEDCSDTLDNDCDGLTDEGSLEQCGDSADNDCDGQTDESGSTWGERFFARPWSESGTPTVGIYTSNGDGTFEDRKNVTFPDDRVYSIVAIGDFDGDKFLDLIVSTPVVGGKQRCSASQACPTGQDCVAGVCQARCTLSNTTSCPAAPVVHDGSACARGDACLSTSQYNGVGRCAPSTILYLARESCPNGSTELLELARLGPGEVVSTVVDADNNGHLDFVVSHNWQRLNASTLLNNGDFTFNRVESTFNPLVQHQVTQRDANGNPTAATCCSWVSALSRTPKDIDGDGIVDLIAWCNPNGGSSPAQFSWWKGRGDGFFGLDNDGNHTGTWKRITPPAGGFQAPASLMSSDDFDGDGDIDIISGLDDDGRPGAISILLNRSGAGAASWATPYRIYDVTPLITSGSDSPGVGYGTSYDFNADGLPDVLAGWTPQTLCAVGTGWSCPYKEIALIPNVTANPCGNGGACTADGTCVECTPDCSGKRCGDDGCGGSCGACPTSETCVASACVPRTACTPDCDGRTCGDNGCGGVCGYCTAGEQCDDGSCVSDCQPQCSVGGAPKECGDDGCGGQCVVFGEKETVVVDQNQSWFVVTPSNAPPRVDVARLLPAFPRRTDNLICATDGVYDLDRVSLHYDWYRNGQFYAAAGNVAILEARHTATGEAWQCRLRATDGVEWSIPRLSETRIIGN